MYPSTLWRCSLPSKIEETFCIEVGKDEWCAVLGNYYPNMPDGQLEMLADLHLEEALGILQKEQGGKTFCTQRLCDQRNIQYKYVLLRAPTCPECLRIKGLMAEFARAPELENANDEDDDGDQGHGAGGDYDEAISAASVSASDSDGSL